MSNTYPQLPHRIICPLAISRCPNLLKCEFTTKSMNKKIVILTSLTHILKKLYKQCGTRTADDEIFENKKCLFYHLKIIKKCQILRKQFHFFDHFLPKSLSTVLVFVPNYLCDFFQCIRRDVRSVCVWEGGAGIPPIFWLQTFCLPKK